MHEFERDSSRRKNRDADAKSGRKELHKQKKIERIIKKNIRKRTM
jgi:hypothetical protein